MITSAVHLIIKGRVQGVCFRTSTQSKSKELDLVGWVCNLNDGNVEIHAEGKKDHLNQLIKFCHQGPPTSSVTEVVVNWISPIGFNKFTIRNARTE